MQDVENKERIVTRLRGLRGDGLAFGASVSVVSAKLICSDDCTSDIALAEIPYDENRDKAWLAQLPELIGWMPDTQRSEFMRNAKISSERSTGMPGTLLRLPGACPVCGRSLTDGKTVDLTMLKGNGENSK